MEGAYDVPYEIRKSFSAPELNELINNFKAYDEDKTGSIKRSELMKILKNLGHREVSAEDITTMMAGVDINNDSELSLNEFLQLNIKLKGESAEETVVTVNKAGREVVEKVSGGAKHSYSIEEREWFSRVINNSLKDDPDCKEILPIDPDSDDLFKAVDNGVILCKLVNIVQPGTVDERVLNKKSTMSVFHVKENINLALASIRSIGCKVVSIDDELIMKRSENVILGLLWQIIRIILFKDINLKHVPELFRLLDEDKEEELNDLLALPIEDLLVRWLNYHLKKAGSDRKVDKIGKQLADSIVYATVLHQLDNDWINLNDVKNETDEKKRAKMVIDGATKIGVNPLIGF